jgi:thioester reductase-like protein
VREDDDGALIFEGRIDRQRKVDGRLLCPEEVEAALRAAPEVAEVACHFVGPAEAPVLWAAVRPADGVPLAGLDERLAAGLRAHLPAWMFPRGYTFGALPRGPTGKARVGSARASAPADALAAILGRVFDCQHIDEHADFAEMGLDSLRAIVASAALLELGLVLAPEALRAAGTLAGLRARLAAGPLLGAPTDARIAAGRALAATLPPVRGAPPQGLPWLLTGATGGLGARVLAARLAAGEPTLALVRAADPEAGLQRLRRAFARYGLPEAILRAPLLQVRVGSLAPGGRGGPEGALDGLAGQLSGLLHLAAAVDLSQPAAALWPVNVGATAALLRLAVEGGGLPVLFASTLSVFVDTDLPPGTFTEAMPAPAGQRVYGGYAETKLEAEALVEAAVALPRCIVRYGLLVGDPITGRGAEADWFGRCLRGLAALGAVPEAALSRGLSLDLSPADAAAAATHGLALALAAGRAPLRAHVAAPAATPLSALLEVMAAAGAPVGRCDEAALMSRLHAALGEPGAPAAALLGLARGLTPERAAGLRALDLFQATGARLCCAEAAACLGRPPIPPTTPALIARLVATALAGEGPANSRGVHG